MDVDTRIDEALALINGARSLPMSSSCVVNRPDLVAALEEIRTALPEQLASARQVVGERDAIIAEGRREAERIAARAGRERATLVSETEVAREARREADEIVARARRDAEEVRRRADDYVDLKLATFEVVLGRTLEAVGRGREKLMGRGPAGRSAAGDPAEPAPGGPARVPDQGGARHDGPEQPAAAALPAPPRPAAGPEAVPEVVPEAEVSGFFDTSVIDVAGLRRLHGGDGGDGADPRGAG